MSTSVFIEPLDVLFLRGNKLFGDPGSYGEALIPPWPSIAAGALRSRMLADDGTDLTAFAHNAVNHPALGTLAAPGPFTITGFHLARRHADGRVERLMPAPADLIVFEAEGGRPFMALRMAPAAPAGIASSAGLPLLPVLAQADRRKPAGGHWLTESGLRQYLAGQTPTAAGDWIASSTLWRFDNRVGVGLDTTQRRASDGQLFSMQAVAMLKNGHPLGSPGQETRADYDVGFLATVSGAEPPTSGLVRLGGDGRAAALHLATAHAPPEPDYAAIATAGRCRLLLTSPGLFANGWLPTGADATTRRDDGAIRFELHGVTGWLVCATVARAEVVSGWDLARRQPKDALRAAPAGSVYWLDELHATPEGLRKLAAAGLWRGTGEDASRRAEGFNRIAIATF
ncbi:MAG TPA: type III-B CRISPR module-associated Cmr3 family protein [Gammaproteobacteria bacterium]|nr:type III-B CRISPR module-associated Cmr3 family protein [Gammaproteobacteria bacterium]